MPTRKVFFAEQQGMNTVIGGRCTDEPACMTMELIYPVGIDGI
jgi:hypothetical protein